MRRFPLLSLALAVLLAGCAPPVDQQTRLAEIDAAAPADWGQRAEPLRVIAIDVRVPESLTVSESNRLIPAADIVWQVEPEGDRRAQVAAIFEEAALRAGSGHDHARPTIVGIEVERFHGLSRRARASTGGVHSIRFTLALRDADSGELLLAPETVQTRVLALGGLAARAAEAAGETPQARVADHLARVLRVRLGGSPAEPGVLLPRSDPWPG